MQFEVGDSVVHPVYGVGHIVQIEKKQFSEQETRLYYEVTLPRSTIWVPIEAQATIGLRLVTAKGQLDHYRTLLKNHPDPPSDNHSELHMDLARRLKEGSFQVTCEVVRDLTVSGWQKPLGRSDATILQKTRERLCHEWATSADVSITEATEEVNALLMTNRQLYKVG
jgi:RNA polymerase-interacting CarD/CdnL/TRCF family regulator